MCIWFKFKTVFKSSTFQDINSEMWSAKERKKVTLKCNAYYFRKKRKAYSL